MQVKPFRKLRQVHNRGKRTRVRDLIRYDMRQMHAAFTGTLPVGSSAETLGHPQVHFPRKLSLGAYTALPNNVYCNHFQQDEPACQLGPPATHPMSPHPTRPPLSLDCVGCTSRQHRTNSTSGLEYCCASTITENACTASCRCQLSSNASADMHSICAVSS